MSEKLRYQHVIWYMIQPYHCVCFASHIQHQIKAAKEAWEYLQGSYYVN